jgi:hypothetical protein
VPVSRERDITSFDHFHRNIYKGVWSKFPFLNNHVQESDVFFFHLIVGVEVSTVNQPLV